MRIIKGLKLGLLIIGVFISGQAFSQVGSDTVWFGKVLKVRAARIDTLKVKVLTGVTGTGVDSIYRVAGKDSIFWIKGGVTYKIKDSVGKGGGGATWGSITGALEDQADLYDTLFNRVKYADTSGMLSPYLRKIDTSGLSNRINLKLNISDTATMLSPYATDNQVNQKLNATDTASLSSRINNRIYDSSFVDWSSSVSITGLTSLTTKQIQYVTIGKVMFINIDFRCASPNGSGTTTTFTIPRNASSWAGEQRGIIHGVNSTTQGACLWKIAAGSNIVEVAIGANDTAFSSWTNGTARRIEGFLMINVQ